MAQTMDQANDMDRAAAEHPERVARLAAQVRQRREERGAGGGYASLGKDAVSHMVPNPHDPRHRDRKIDARGLNRVLALDVDGRTCTAESGVTFCDLVPITLRHGLLPMLVPELKTITLGGAVSGCSVESMSYKYGGFHDSCVEYEVVTGTGEVLRVSRERDPLLFEMMHGSYGTLGILTALTFRLVPARPYVEMTYEVYGDFAAFHQALRARCQQTGTGAPDFIDGIAHGPDELVLCLGRFADRGPQVSSYTWLDVFYQSTRRRQRDFLTTFDYLFRYDTECHWLSRTVPGLESKPVRFLLGRWLLGSTNLLTWSRRLRPVLKLQRRPDVVVDVFIPDEQSEAFWGWYQETLRYYPLWLVPYRTARPYPWIAPAHAARASGLFIDFAVYGKKNDTPGVDYSKLLEDKTLELGGIKTLISRNHFTRERFWQVYDRDNYQAVKQRTDPDNLFRDLYDKFNFQAAG